MNDPVPLTLETPFTKGIFGEDIGSDAPGPAYSHHLFIGNKNVKVFLKGANSAA